MITVEVPALLRNADHVVVSAAINSDGGSLSQGEEELWYRIPLEYEEFLSTDSDAFLVGMLYNGLTRGEDIRLKGVVSARLFYAINHYLIPALCLSNPLYKQIRIIADILRTVDTNEGFVAATGLSCGVDSFATLIDHENDDSPFEIEYFTFFNVGSHGDFGGEQARIMFHKRLKRISDYATSYGKKVISVDSNLSEVLRMNFQQTHTLRNISAALLFQKLFKNYYYASAYRFDHFKLNPKDTSDSDILNLGFLSTESTSFFSGASQYQRVERIKLISTEETTYKYLDVCTNLFQHGRIINCTQCDKCLRTALTLDLIGKLDEYRTVFDLPKYFGLKYDFIGKVIATRYEVALNKELFEFMKNKINLTPYYKAAITYTLRSWKNKGKKKLKKTIKIFH